MDNGWLGLVAIVFLGAGLAWTFFYASRGGHDYAVRDIKEALQRRQETRRAKLEHRYYSDEFYAWWDARERELGYSIPEFAARAQWIQKRGGDWNA